MKQKALALITSLAMLVTICVPGTFAVEAAEQSVCEKTEHIHDESCCQAANTENNEETKQSESAQPVCNCTPVDGVYAETCPLYQVPKQPEKKECTCGAIAGEDGTIIHAEDCPLYVAPLVPEKPAHIEGCADGCTVEGCTCPCHELSMFERLMACETYDELSALLDNMTDEDFATFSEEEIVQILEKNTALEPSPLPPIGEGTADVPADEPVISEIIYPTVNFDNVAHFGAPVEG